MTRIQRLLAQCLDEIEQGESVQQCLARHPERREELEPLLYAAQRIRSAPRIGPSEAFRQDARARMLSTIRARTRVEEPDRGPERAGILDRLKLNLRLPVVLSRLTVPALSIIVIVLLSGMTGIGVVYASSDSLPGDSLYPVKLASERVRLALSSGQTAEARLRLRLAGERLLEAARLTEMGMDDEVGSLMARYTDEVEAAGSILERQHAEGKDVTVLSQQLQEDVAQQQAMLAEIRERVSEGTRPSVERAMTASRAAASEALTTATPAAGETPRPTGVTEPPPTPTPTATRTPSIEVAPGETPVPAEPTKTPHSPGLAITAEPSSRTKTPPSVAKTKQPAVETSTPEPPGKTNTPQPPVETNTPQPPDDAHATRPPKKTNTPQPPDDTNVTRPPGQTKTPEPPGQTNTPQPPGQANTPGPPGRTNTPQPPGQTNTPQPPGQTNTPQPPGQTDAPGSGP